MSWRWILAFACGCGRIGFAVESASDGDALHDARSLDAPALYNTALAFWRFDDGVGILARDSTGNGNTLTLENGPTWTTGVSNDAIQTDGVDDYLAAPSLDLSTTMAVTVSFWVLRTYGSGVPHTLVELTDNFNTHDDGFGLFPDDLSACAAQILLDTRGNAGYDSSCYAQPSSGVWHHLVAVFDRSQPAGQESQLYIDGAIATAVTRPTQSDNTNPFGAEPFFVFARGGVQEYNAGTMDELAIFARALTPAEIGQL